MNGSEETAMEILEEAKRYIESLNAIPGFLDKAGLKRRTPSQGDYTFAGIR